MRSRLRDESAGSRFGICSRWVARRISRWEIVGFDSKFCQTRGGALKSIDFDDLVCSGRFYRYIPMGK